MSIRYLVSFKEYLVVKHPSNSTESTTTFFVLPKQGEAAATLKGKEGVPMHRVDDYKDLKRMALRDHYPIPLISGLLAGYKRYISLQN